MSNFIQAIHPSRPIQEDAEVIVDTFGHDGTKMITGMHVLDVQCYARTHTLKYSDGTSRVIFYTKVNPEGDIFNPWGLYSEGAQEKFERHRGKPQWMFKEVNKDVFDHYMRFLETRNESHLRIAERIMRNA